MKIVRDEELRAGSWDAWWRLAHIMMSRVMALVSFCPVIGGGTDWEGQGSSRFRRATVLKLSFLAYLSFIHISSVLLLLSL